MNKLFILLLMMPVVGFAAELDELDGYLCIPSYSTGFAFGKSGKWVPTKFNVSDEKYVLRKKDTGWVWGELGQKWFQFLSCKDLGEGYLECNGITTEIRMNRLTLRFQIIDPIGYVVDDMKVDGKFTPSFTIGTCSRL